MSLKIIVAVILCANYLQASDFSGELAFRYNSLVNNTGDTDGNKYHGEANFKYHDLSAHDEFKADARFFYNDLGYLQYSAPELFAKWNINLGSSALQSDKIQKEDKSQVNELEIAVGRKILQWSSMDQIWGFGKLNNRINFDYFQPGQEGLTGLNLVWNKDYFKAAIFMSYIYVPELNPQIKNNNEAGSVTAKNAWSTTPSREADLNDSGNPILINYRVNNPEIDDIVFNASIGGMLAFENDSWGAEVFAIDKPENNITIRAELELETLQNDANVSITPELYRHSVMGGQVFKKFNGYKAYMGYLFSKPNRIPLKDQVITKKINLRTEKKQEEFFGAGITRETTHSRYGVHYVARISSFDRVTEELVEEPRWNQALNLFFERRLSEKFTIFADIKYDSLTFDRLYHFDVHYLPIAALKLTLGANVIGTSEKQTSFWTPYRTNDSVYMRAAYVF